MSVIGYMITISAAIVGTSLFEIGCHFLLDVLPYKIYCIYYKLVVYGGKKGPKPRLHPKVDFAYKSRIRWWEYVKMWF